MIWLGRDIIMVSQSTDYRYCYERESRVLVLGNESKFRDSKTE